MTTKDDGDKGKYWWNKNKTSKNEKPGWWSQQNNGTKIIVIIGCLCGLLLILKFLLVTTFSADDDSLTVVQSAAQQNIIILNSTGKANGQYYHVTGTVLNNNSFDADFVKIILKGYDKNGKLVKADFTYARNDSDSMIPAKANGTFEEDLEDPNGQIVKYEVVVASASKADPDLQTTTKISSTETSTTSNTSTPPSEDYDRGYDSGYYEGVMDSYSNEQYDDNLAKTLNVRDMYRYGYREGYKQGYSDIENGRSLQKPQLSFNAYYDPRTGETING